MCSILEKLHNIIEVLDLSSGHIPEGKYLEAMNSMRDIFNHINLRNERSIIESLRVGINENQNEISWWVETKM